MSVDDETREEAVEPRNEGPCGCPGEVRYRAALERIVNLDPNACGLHGDTLCSGAKEMAELARDALSPKVPK